MRTEQDLMVRLAENQAALRPVLQKLADAERGGFDDSTRNHIRNLDVYLARLLEETVNGRSQLIQEIRSEIRLLARTIAALRSEEHTSELQSLMRISYAAFCLKKKNNRTHTTHTRSTSQ